MLLILQLITTSHLMIMIDSSVYSFTGNPYMFN